MAAKGSQAEIGLHLAPKSPPNGASMALQRWVFLLESVHPSVHEDKDSSHPPTRHSRVRSC